jgi:16S rRNA (guanine1207-N2)-methyltransferase
MTRWSHDPEGAADALMRRSLDVIGHPGRILAGYQSGSLPAALAGDGRAVAVWNRRLEGGYPAAAWPSGGPFDLALIRLPKAKDEQEMAAHAALSVLDDGGRLVLYGGNEEGIRSAASMLKALCGTMETLTVRGHGRVIAATRPTNPTRLRPSLAHWRCVTQLQIAGAARAWISYPGTFAAGRLDEGTALLLSALPRLGNQASVLDYGCGTGPVGFALLHQFVGLAVDMVDADAVAVEAARENVPQARTSIGARLGDAPGAAYDAILSNPPIHRGIGENHAVLEQLIADAPRHLKSGGTLQVVAQRRVALDQLFAKSFAAAAVVAETGRYRVWRAS